MKGDLMSENMKQSNNTSNGSQSELDIPGAMLVMLQVCGQTLLKVLLKHRVSTTKSHEKFTLISYSIWC